MRHYRSWRRASYVASGGPVRHKLAPTPRQSRRTALQGVAGLCRKLLISNLQCRAARDLQDKVPTQWRAPSITTSPRRNDEDTQKSRVAGLLGLGQAAILRKVQP